MFKVNCYLSEPMFPATIMQTHTSDLQILKQKKKKKKLIICGSHIFPLKEGASCLPLVYLAILSLTKRRAAGVT